MARAAEIVKRLVIGRALRSEETHAAELPKRLALPIFASDALSSVAYATQEMLLVLTVGGLAYTYLTGWLAGGVVLLMAVVVLSYRQVVRAYPSGGGSYEVVSTNLGPRSGLVVAAALLVDYVMTVAVSVAAGVDNIVSAVPSLHDARVGLALGFVVLLAAINLRGVRESGRAFAAPTYLFILGVLVMCAIGLARWAAGDPPVAQSAGYGIRPEPGEADLAGAAVVMLALRAFSSGSSALTGVEAISNGVPAFRPPKSRNAATTLAAMGLIAIVLFSGVTALALISDVHIADDACRLTGFPGDCENAPQRTVIAQVAAAVFGGDESFGFYYIQTVTALILILAANTAFNGFPLLASVLARHRYLPRQLYTRGDRLTYSNGIIALATVAGLLLWVYRASVTSLIHLYILGVFTSFTLSQIGMVRHWNRTLRTGADPAARHRIHTARLINGVGAAITGLVLAIVLVTKFLEGAWLAVAAAVLLWLTMRGIRRHYDSTAAELAVTDPRAEYLPPSRIHVVVPVSTLHKPTLRALAYARALKPDTLEAVTASVEPEDVRQLRRQWEEAGIDVPLKVLDSPYREITRAIVGYVRSIGVSSPRDVINVIIPEYVVGHWWEQPLHNQSALRLKSRLLFTPGIMVTSVPWRLSSSAHAAARSPGQAPGSVRRGEPPPSRPRQPTGGPGDTGS
ncbi:amino acid permease [Streptomyces sp. bgisy100]|uniref:APC family permease n=1 Tax=Streptomyces sp. bgisy100 TaxID=3413783 RepID=UPI003D7211D1